jgi:Zn-dependent protease with chaperone function
MATEEMSPQRKSAYYKYRQGVAEMQKGHVEKAMDLLRASIEEDPDYIEPRQWLAHYYIRQDDVHHAVRELESIIHIDHNHEEAWQLLRKISPATAARLERLHTIAPDPFVVQRKAPLTEDVVDSIDLATEEDDWEASEPEGERTIGADPFVRAPLAADMLDEETPQDAEPAPRQEVAAMDQRGGYAWEYEQDRPYLERWRAEPVVQQMTAKIQELWKDRDAWDRVLELCAHLDKRLHPAIFQAAEQAAARLGVDMPEIFVFPERCLHPVIIKDRDPIIAVPTGMMRALTPEQMLFQIGREIGHIHTGYVAEMQVVKIITARRAALVGDVASALTEFLEDHLKFWDEKLSRDEVMRLKRLGHAWQQRCELTADRAGLICCRDIKVACDAMAKTTARSHEVAATLDAETLLAEYKHRDVGSLAAIPVEESPSRNPQYVAYRIHMLRWWATTPQAKELIGA